jgi:hypothetical protein
LLSSLLAFSMVHCAPALGEDDEPSAATARAIRTRCDFVPGCVEAFETRQGPFVADFSKTDSGLRRLTVRYVEPPEGRLLRCGVRIPPPSIVFVVGDRSIVRPMNLSCPGTWGDNGGAPNVAVFTLFEEADPALWDAIFPPQADGSRWYALQVALVNGRGEWDSRHGANYRLILEE